MRSCLISIVAIFCNLISAKPVGVSKKGQIENTILLDSNDFYLCDCNVIIGPEEANDVFKGTVKSIVRIDSDYVRYEVMFEVKKIIKGRIKKNSIIINVPCLNVGCCGIPFDVGEDYVVYTFIRNGILYTNSCTLTEKISKKQM